MIRHRRKPPRRRELRLQLAWREYDRHDRPESYRMMDEAKGWAI